MPEGIALNQAAISGSNDAAGRQLSQTVPEGRTTSWVFDGAGREQSVSVDGALVSSVDRDVLNRRVVVNDHSSPDGLITEHELRFDRCGRLIGRARGNQSLAWVYDADGNRSNFTDANGSTTSYVREGDGRVTSMSNSLLGRAEFGYDAAGHLGRSVIADLVQDWVYRGGKLTEQTPHHYWGGAGSCYGDHVDRP
ncbi:RHS repeat protein [Arthrobacter alpinus]|uniref:RHS repeat protein n=1 Tax=Arthrobacter alpinus TaxID=656366 RepID=UPI00094251B2|nr:RHS repeat protein [Arthrobacter alpinus]